jgi:hypothetical protein
MATDASDIFHFYLKQLGDLPIVQEIIHDNETVGIEFYKDGAGTVCRFYGHGRVVIQHNTDALEFRPTQGMFLNNKLKTRTFNILYFVKFWETRNNQFIINLSSEPSPKWKNGNLTRRSVGVGLDLAVSTL